MSQDAESNTTSQYQAKLYPETQPVEGASKPTLGVCLSGGGSRALSCALGQLSALNSINTPHDSATKLIDHVHHLSSVSGGTWASVLYTFLPDTIDGKSVTDADFLITPVAPAQLTKGGNTDSSPGNVQYMNPFCMGTAPQQFSADVIAHVLYTLWNWGFFSNSERLRWFWIAAVGEIILKRFGLYAAIYDESKVYIEPAKFFSASQAEIEQNITKFNPELRPNDFYYPRRPKRPALVVNTNLTQEVDVESPVQIPVQATPTDTGILGESPDQSIIGGGSVESFGFTSTLVGPGSPNGFADVNTDRRYSLCDIAGCSSAFFAEYLLQYMNEAINEIVQGIADYLRNKLQLPKGIANSIAKAIRDLLKPFLDVNAAKLIPQYNYWTVGDVSDSRPKNVTRGFTDGGNFDNTGVLGMLARTDVNRIVSFVNTEAPIQESEGEVIVASQLALLFGYQDKPIDGKYVSWGGMDPKNPMSYVQVFDDAANSDPKGAFHELRQGLLAASTGNTNKSSDLGTETAAFTQKLTTVKNRVAGIKGGREVTVLWVYNNRVNNWQEQITDAGIQQDLSDGQPSTGDATGPLANFPNYSTVSQIYLDKEAVNMLAQLSAWNVAQLTNQISALLKP